MEIRLIVLGAMLGVFLFSGYCGSAIAAESKVTYMLTVDATPKDSHIKILKLNKKYKPGIKLQPGTYEIYVSRAGFKPKTTPVTIGSPALPGEPRLVSGTSEMTINVKLDKIGDSK
jgi:hypothetical protein